MIVIPKQSFKVLSNLHFNVRISLIHLIGHRTFNFKVSFKYLIRSYKSRVKNFFQILLKLCFLAFFLLKHIHSYPSKPEYLCKVSFMFRLCQVLNQSQFSPHILRRIQIQGFVFRNFKLFSSLIKILLCSIKRLK